MIMFHICWINTAFRNTVIAEWRSRSAPVMREAGHNPGTHGKRYATRTEDRLQVLRDATERAKIPA